MNPTIIEKAPALRSGGYVIDFWGAGYDIADRMGLSEEINHHGYQVQEVRIVNRKGERVSGFPVLAFARSTRGRYTSLPRGVLAVNLQENRRERGDDLQRQHLFCRAVTQQCPRELCQWARTRLRSGGWRRWASFTGSRAGFRSPGEVRELPWIQGSRLKHPVTNRATSWRT
jgi:hypothetical protein